jgi:hypothetical protein
MVANEPLHVTFGLKVGKLWGFEDFSPSSGMLSATVNARNFAQNCLELSKFAKISKKQNFEIPPKIEI